MGSSPPRRDLRADVRAITLLAVGLMLATMGVVAVTRTRWLAGWAAAFALGAIVSPTDPLAPPPSPAGWACRGARSPLLEGESLVNDASALVVYRLAMVPWWSGASRRMAVGFAISLAVRSLRAALDRLAQVAPQPKRGRLEEIRNTGNPAALAQ